MDSRNNEESKGLSTAFQHATNMRTREEWLHAVLYGGRVSRIGQHLALVIYHLADSATNIAKLSARDLERITGWGRTAIIKSVNELHDLGEFLRVAWGQGRAKSTFELQGIIAEVMAAKKAERDAATTADASGSVREGATRTDATEATNGSVHVEDAKAATKAATTASGRRSVHEADTKPDLGGTIGGETTSKIESHSLTLSPREREKPAAPDWMISEDGGFEGQVFELTGVEVGALQTTYGYLDFPADLVAVDQFLGRQFSQLEHRPVAAECLARMHTYLAKRNREVREFRLAMGMASGKQPRKPAEPIVPPEPPSCWFDKDARLQVANGFEVELLQTVGGNQMRLREELDKASGFVGLSVRGPQLMAKVRARVTDQVKGGRAASPSSPSTRSKLGDKTELARALREIEEEKQSKRGGIPRGN